MKRAASRDVGEITPWEGSGIREVCVYVNPKPISATRFVLGVVWFWVVFLFLISNVQFKVP